MMQMVKIKRFDTNITFTNYPRLLLICGTTQIFMSSCRMLTSRLSLKSCPPLPSPLNHDYFTYCSCADNKNKVINNILSLPKTEL